ncbi:MAG: hypothetical protein E7379_03640 [Clostridiales bacterium]|nr:hypothetical protein [Clostridiales bacterium]
MTNEQIYKLINETQEIISAGYSMVESFSGLTEDQVFEIYQEIDQEEVKLKALCKEYEKRTGEKLYPQVDKEDLLFSDIFEKRLNITDAMRTYRTNSGIPGNVRASLGMYRTADEHKGYIEDSLDRDIP